VINPSSTPGIRSAAFRLMLTTTALSFSSYSLLLPVVPLWAERGGSGALGSGATTAVLMATTVGTQLAVPWLLARVGHRWVLAAGALLLGLPSPFFAPSPDLAPVLVLSGIRGIGFGLVTVAGSALIAELVPREQHGRATGYYGLAVGLPQIALYGGGVAMADAFGFPAVFLVAGLAPVLGALAVPGIRGARRRVPSRTRSPRPPVRSSAAPLVAMLTCAVAQGGIITFLPLAVPGGGLVVPAALLATAAGAMLGRLAGGELVDRLGWGGRLLVPGMLLAAAGLAAEVLGGDVLVVAGAAVVGFGFGIVQNDSLTTLFTAFGAAGYGVASALWNIAFDAGTGVGALGIGAVADGFGYPAGFASAAALLGVGVVVALLVPARRTRAGRVPGSRS
jgi:Arabinose efflux permease